jgi:hypothetical protein
LWKFVCRHHIWLKIAGLIFSGAYCAHALVLVNLMVRNIAMQSLGWAMSLWLVYILVLSLDLVEEKDAHSYKHIPAGKQA